MNCNKFIKTEIVKLKKDEKFITLYKYGRGKKERLFVVTTERIYEISIK